MCSGSRTMAEKGAHETRPSALPHRSPPGRGPRKDDARLDPRVSLPASENPELVDSADCGVGQTGPVFFIPGEQHDVSTRSCTIPPHTPVLWPTWSLFNDYPCADRTFQPGPGQTLEDFRAQGDDEDED